MSSFDEILNEIFGKIQENGKAIPNTIAALAGEIEVSAAQLSRIKSGKSSLTDKVVEKIVGKFAEDEEYAKTLQDKLKKIQLESITENLGISISQETTKSLSGINAIDEITKLFDTLSLKEGNLLMVDYRDFPQAVSSGAYPSLVETTIKAIESGLCFAMFQPFGNRLSLLKKHNQLSERTESIHDPNLYENANQFLSSFFYLISLASKVREFYLNVKNNLSSEKKGQIVLYEASYKENNKVFGALPSIIASGIQSRLFYTSFFDADQHQTKIYEWISAPENEHFFVERSKLSLSPDAVKMQFNPIPAYWKQTTKLPETDEQLEEAHKNFGFKKLFNEEEVVKWKIWSQEKN